jgi:hypothetical protein
LVVLVGVWWAAVNTAIVRDNILAQIPWKDRPFSLGFCQMAFWFVLVFVCLVFLWALLWDHNTMTESALTLMGIAAATGLGAVAANTTNADALKSADQALRAAGFNSRHDTETLISKLAGKKQERQQLQAAVPPNDAQIAALDGEIQQLQACKSVYDAQTANYTSDGFLRDLITDRDGDHTLYRVQIVAWTVVLGLVFLVGVYRDVSMPNFSNILLTLMAISGGSYVGFKFPAQA